MNFLTSPNTIYAFMSFLAGISVYLGESDPSQSKIKLISVPSSNEIKPMEKSKDRLFAHSNILQIKFFIMRYICTTSGILQGFYLLFCELNGFSPSKTSQKAFVINSITFFAALFRIWCYHTLQNHFTFQLKVTKEQKIIQSGPYRYLAHPSYTGLMVTNASVAIGLLGPFNGLLDCLTNFNLKSVFTLFLSTCALITNFWFWFYMVRYRIPDEEQMLKQHFGKEYDEFLANRWRLIPFVY